MTKPKIRIGHGYDLHRLVESRQLILGGINIPHHMGLLGHSDADCVTHAIADSIFGALALPDIGHYFPDTDPANKNLDSKLILAKAHQECIHGGYRISNIDTTIVAQKPKIGPYIHEMKKCLSATLGIDDTSIGIKATTNEALGPVGREEAIACFAVSLLEKI
jgi:2-C-methyl-D-erythritol 2,4-cyclodiphosphate synthase